MAHTKPTTLVLKLALFAFGGFALLAGTGCATVAPHERAKLAHPTMAVDDPATMGESHLRAISEGAVGGNGGTGSGCGCN